MKHQANFISSTAILVILMSNVLFSQSGWFEQPSGVGVILTDIQFIGADTGWAAGWQGTILHTTDGGQSWTTQRWDPDFARVNGLFFRDADTGWVAVDDGSVLQTTDGGANWSEQSSGWNYLLDVYFVDANNGWVLGGEGTILHTTNGGANWSKQPTGQFTDFYAGTFFDVNTGVAAGYEGNIMRTTNGGTTWLQQSNGLAGSFNAVSFVNSNDGWAAGYKGTFEGGIVAHTTDGGVTWAVQKEISEVNSLNGMFFVDAQNGWAAGEGSFGSDAKIYHTSDGGDNWILQPHGGIVPNLKAMWFTDANTGWIVGDNGVILHTTTGGVTAIRNISNALIPGKFLLEQNYPNPFNPSTDIKFSLPNAAFTTLKIYDIQGKEVATLIDEKLTAGKYQTSLDASGFPSGVYYYRLQSEGSAETKMMILLK